MIYGHRHTNLLMYVLEIIRQGGWYEYNYYFGMGEDNPTVFSGLHRPNGTSLPEPRKRMDA